MRRKVKGKWGRIKSGSKGGSEGKDKQDLLLKYFDKFYNRSTHKKLKSNFQRNQARAL